MFRVIMNPGTDSRKLIGTYNTESAAKGVRTRKAGKDPHNTYAVLADNTPEPTTTPTTTEVSATYDDPFVTIIPANIVHLMKHAHTASARSMWKRIVVKKYGKKAMEEALKA